MRMALALQAQVGRPRRRTAVEASIKSQQKIERKEKRLANFKSSGKKANPMWLSGECMCVCVCCVCVCVCVCVHVHVWIAIFLPLTLTH
jgi:Flp pilus assembly protein TadB